MAKEMRRRESEGENCSGSNSFSSAARVNDKRKMVVTRRDDVNFANWCTRHRINKKICTRRASGGRDEALRNDATLYEPRELVAFFFVFFFCFHYYLFSYPIAVLCPAAFC